MKPAAPTTPFVKKKLVTTPSFPAPDQRWSAALVLSLIDDRLAGWELHELIYSLPDGHEPIRFDASVIQEHLQDLAYRLHSHAGAWVKETHGQAARNDRLKGHELRETD
ncbi:MAG TPA: hypothetical protein VGN57_21920 [Pirellulaceae bacterium]|jgi:hypothetical protein|nr:hypothetical protein [Pirellulaceae bacterium]